MINKWKEAVDNSKVFDAILNDLFKTSDCICHALLVAKLHTYRLSLLALKMIQDYLLNRKQRTKIRSSYSTWENITSGIPQVSILGRPPCLRSFHVTYFWNMRILVSLTKQVISTLWDCKQYSRSNRESYQYYQETLGWPTIIWKQILTKRHLLLSAQKEANIQIANRRIKCSKPQNYWE